MKKDIDLDELIASRDTPWFVGDSWCNPMYFFDDPRRQQRHVNEPQCQEKDMVLQWYSTALHVSMITMDASSMGYKQLEVA